MKMSQEMREYKLFCVVNKLQENRIESLEKFYIIKGGRK